MFSKIYYINLDRRTDRNENVKKLIKRHGLEHMTERVSAVDGKKLNLDLIPETIITKKGIENAKNKTMKTGVPMTSGGIGCAISHKNIWDMINRNNIGAALILEDDIRMDNNFNDLIKKYSKLAPTSYDVLFLGYHPGSIKHVDVSSPDTFVRATRVYGTFGYIVSLKGAKQLLKLFPIEDQIDTEIYRGFSNRGIDAYVIRPELRFITSDTSEESKEFGTDIQVRETFGQSSSIMSDLFDLLMLVVVVIMLFLLIDILVKM